MFNIEHFLDLTGYEETRKDRRKGIEGSQEFFSQIFVFLLLNVLKCLNIYIEIDYF